MEEKKLDTEKKEEAVLRGSRGTTHSHVAPDGTVYTHTHSHEHTKAVLNRLSRAIGHLESIKRMV